MANTKAHYVGDGQTKQFNIPFPYLRKEHVHLFINGAEHNFTWVSQSIIETADAPQNKAQILLLRITPPEPIYEVHNNRPVPALYFNELTRQALYRTEETQESDKIEIFKDAAEGARNDAIVAKNFAARWASDPENGDLIIDGQNAPNRSAYHWAQKARQASEATSAGEARVNNLITAIQASTSGFRYGEFYDFGTIADSRELFSTDLGNLTK